MYRSSESSVNYLLKDIKHISPKIFQRVKNRSSHRRCSVKKGVLRNYAKFTGKHLCQSFFFNKVAGLRPGDSGTGVFL